MRSKGPGSSSRSRTTASAPTTTPSSPACRSPQHRGRDRTARARQVDDRERDQFFHCLTFHGYNLKHSCGHGSDDVANLLATLNLHVFTLHTLLDCLRGCWRQNRAKAGTPRRSPENLSDAGRFPIARPDRVCNCVRPARCQRRAAVARPRACATPRNRPAGTRRSAAAPRRLVLVRAHLQIGCLQCPEGTLDVRGGLATVHAVGRRELPGGQRGAVHKQAVQGSLPGDLILRAGRRSRCR